MLWLQSYAPETFSLRLPFWTVTRLSYSGQQENKDDEALIVVRLNGDNTCVIGVVEQVKDMNENARAIADNAKATCLNEDDLMQTPSQREFEKKLRAEA